MPVCPNCGHDTADVQARFCPSCGRPLHAESASEATSSLTLGAAVREDTGEIEADAAPVDPSMVERLQAGTALLVVKRGPSSGARFLLDADLTTAGRHHDSGIFLDDVTVSRRHADFVRDSNGFRIRDKGSLNGTYVNRSRIDDIQLNNGDEVQIGKYRLTFVAAVAPGPGEST